MAPAADPTASIVLTGPESSGKSTLAAALSGRLRRPLVAEVARNYLQTHGANYQRADLAAIAAEQNRQEMLARQHAAPVVDTDLTVIVIWSRERFGAVDSSILRTLAAAPPRVYLLAQPDLPWVPDPLRENPGDRGRLHGLYVELLEEQSWPWRNVAGMADNRLQNALLALQDMGIRMPDQDGA